MLMGPTGAVFLNLSLLLQLTAIILLVLKKAHNQAVRLTKWGCSAVFGALSVLLAGLVSGRFDMVYAYKFTDRSLPVLYRFAALWAGGEGVMLLLLGLVSALTLLLTGREKNLQVRRVLFKYFLSAQIIIQGLLRAIGNPFAEIPGGGEGLGLSPVLQSPGMLIHPPAVLLGYVLCLIPLAYLLSARSIKDIKGSHFIKCRRWAWTAWTVQTFALLSGGIWTYASQGQGRYWTWDPVDSANLAVWLLLSALLYCMAERNRLYHRELLLSFFVVLSTLYAVILSGGSLLKPVYASWSHRLQKPALELILAMAVCTAGVYLYYSRKTGLGEKTSSRAVLYLSFTAGLIAAANLLVPDTVLLPWGYVIERSGLLNTVFSFVGAMLLLELARYAFGKTGNIKAAGFGTAAGIAAARLTAVLSGRDRAMASFNVFAFIVCLTAISQLAYRICFIDRIRSGREYRFLFMHAALLVLAVGLIGSGGFNLQKEWVLESGQNVGVGRYSVSNAGIECRDELKSVMAAIRMEDGNKAVNLFPKLKYDEKQGQYFGKAEIKSGFLYDVFVVLSYFDMSGRARLLVRLNPLVSWLWVGGILLVIGGIYGARQQT